MCKECGLVTKLNENGCSSILKLCIGKKDKHQNTRVKEISHIVITPDDLCGLGLIGFESYNKKNAEISSIQRVVTEQFNNTIKPATSWNEHLENLISIQRL